MNAFADTSGADVQAGFRKDSDYEITKINDSGASQNNRLNVIEKYISKYAEMDMRLPFLAKSGDIIVGFVDFECTANFDKIAVRVGNSSDVEVGAGTGLQGAGFTASSSLLEQSDQGKLTFAAGFVVVHLRRISDGGFPAQGPIEKKPRTE
jgi:hypothetical protein